MQLSLSHTTKFNYSYDPLDQVSLLNMSLFDPFQELQSLDLSENWFEGVYENRGLANLENLKTLDLGYCGLTTLQGLANFINLQVLDLSCNFNITRGSLERQGRLLR
ncbi:receptor-like protein 45 [Citrus sinensis]|uniref:receptor-like protein 45 n=1 Tax=Citrus sinensis TaxID=2711 RepID=UPI002277990D|nr:receptor-like protein 45 [Citrus sinensis]